MSTKRVLTACAAIMLLKFVNTSNYEDEVNLQATLFTNYSKNIRPRNTMDHKTHIEVHLSLTSIVGLDELHEVLTSVCVIFVSWIDNNLAWNPFRHGNITHITIDKNLIWSPGFVVTNSVTNLEGVGQAGSSTHVFAYGAVLWEFGHLMQTKCDIDVTNYPFDTQHCTIRLMPIGLRYDHVYLSTYPMETLYFSENNAWILVSTSSKIAYFGPQPFVKYYVTLERRYTFYILNLFSPVLIMAFLNSMVFVLPADSGERIGYAITCLLSLSVYMTYASENLPRSSKPLPIITLVLICYIVISALISVGTVTGLRLHIRESSKSPPTILIKLFSLSCETCTRKRKVDVLKELNDVEKAWPDVVSKDVSWKDIANRFDRLCFIISNFCTFLLAFLYFMIVRM